MKKWLKRVRAAVLMGLAWAVVWAPVGLLVGLIVDPDGSMDEPWVVVGTVPGFLCGALFSALLGIPEGHRRLDEFSLRRSGAWGAVSGLLAIVLPVTGALGTPNTEHPLWRWRAMIIGAVTLLSSVSAVGSVWLAKIANKRALRNGSTDVV